jgi:hypothetical protein
MRNPNREIGLVLIHLLSPFIRPSAQLFIPFRKEQESQRDISEPIATTLLPIY